MSPGLILSFCVLLKCHFVIYQTEAWYSWRRFCESQCLSHNFSIKWRIAQWMSKVVFDVVLKFRVSPLMFCEGWALFNNQLLSTAKSKGLLIFYPVSCDYNIVRERRCAQKSYRVKTMSTGSMKLPETFRLFW